MRRLIISLFVLLLLSCHAPALAQRGGGRSPIFRPPTSRGGAAPTVVRPTIPRITRPPRSLDPARRQSIPRAQPGQRAGAPRTGSAAGSPTFKAAPVPPAGSPQVNAARTQARTTLDQLRASRQSRQRSSTALGSGTVSPGVPLKARQTLQHIEKTGQPPPGFQGGRQFMNDGRGRGQVLPRADARGNPITYREYDVNPYRRGVNRGAERLVRGSDGSAYYTADHYKTFVKIN